MTDAAGTTTWGLDDRGRIVSEDGPFASDTVTAGYDARGRLTNLAFRTYTWSYGYDGLDRIISISAPEGAYSLGWYQSGRRLTGITYANGVHADYAYDSLVRPVTLTYSNSQETLLSIDYSYDAGDRRTNESWNTGRKVGYDYDRADQLIEAFSANRIAANADYDYDPAGNPIRRTVMGVSVTNAFNSLNQQIYTDWTGMTLSVAGSVNYNAGTVVVEGVTAERYGDTFTAQGVSLSPGTNQIEAVYYGPMFTNAGHIATDTVTVVVGDRDISYDPSGNLTNDGVYVYTYDTANRLTEVTDLSSGSNLLSCTYDGLGRRKAVTRDGTNTERYVYVPGTWLVLAVLDGSGNVKELYTHGPDLSGTVGGAGPARHRAGGSGAGGIGGILAVQDIDNAETYALHADTMGNIVMATDTNGHEAATYRYTPFGRLTTASGQFKSRYLFSSKEYDEAVGLYYYGYRYYQPDRGRWLTRDLIGEMDDPNVYRYLANGPHLASDPFGLFSWRGFGHGVWDVVSEPFKATSDAFLLAPMVGINNLISDTEITLEDVQFSSMLASGTRQRRLGGDSGLLAAGKGYGQLAVTVGTVGIYPMGKNLGENLALYLEGEITLEELDYRLSRGAGAQSAGAAMACTMSKVTGRGWTGRAPKGRIQFGKTENQASHAFRHIEKAGLDRAKVSRAIGKDIGRVARGLQHGLTKRSVTVNGIKLHYHAYKLPDGTINVGRITISKRGR
jgi:RHS repeat-associated protein